jgi:hypothetical protein
MAWQIVGAQGGTFLTMTYGSQHPELDPTEANLPHMPFWPL